MSSAVPYIAPWQTDWTRYATQVRQLQENAQGNWTITVAGGQWWRIVYAYARVATSAAGGDRLAGLAMLSGGAVQFVASSSLVQSASQDVHYAFGPGMSSTGVIGASGIGAVSVGLPDVLWPSGTVIQFGLNVIPIGDSAAEGPFVAAETYAEERPGTLVPLAETPVLA